MMRHPCSACGGRGPHDGPGHAYTTDPNFREAEARHWDRLIDGMKTDLVTAFERAWMDVMLKNVPAPDDDYWRERDGTLPGGPEGAIGDTVELPRADAQAISTRIETLIDHLKYLDAMSASIDAQGMHEIRSVLIVLALMLDTAIEAA